MVEPGSPINAARSHANPVEVLAGGGEMGALMRSIDWSTTAIGPVEDWSPALRTMVRMLLVNGEAGERVNRIMESIPDGLVTFDPEWRYTFVNAPAERILGRPRSDLVGTRVWDEFPSVVGTEVERQLRRTLAEQVTCEFEGHDVGLGRWYENRAFPMPEGGIAVYFRDITERRRAEEALRRGEERLRRYFDLGLIGMAITSPDKGILEVNEEICRILGYAREELLTKTWAELTHVDDLPADVAQFGRVVAGEIDAYSIEKRWIRKDGRVVDSIISIKCVRRADGAVDYVVALLQDITERKRAEAALHRDALVLANVSDTVIATDLDGTITFWNDGATRLFGWTADEMVGRPYAERFPEPDRSWIAEQIRSRAGGSDWVGEYLDYRKDGSRVWVDARIRRVTDESGRPHGTIGLARDITERKRAEEALRASKTRLGADLAAMTHLQEVSVRLVSDGGEAPLLLEIVDAAIAITGADAGTVQLYNPQADTLEVVASRGLDADALASFGTVRPGQNTCGTALQRHERVVVEDVTTNPIFVGTPQLEGMLAAGIRAAQSTPLVDRAGRIVGMLSTLYREPRLPAEADLRVVDLLARQAADWIERTRAEGTIKRAKESAEQASRVKDEFLATVSHELRTPLAAILLWSQLLESTAPRSGTDAQALRAIRESARAQQRLIEDLLDVSRMLAGEMRLDMQEVELTPILHAALDIARPMAVAKRIEIETALDPWAGPVRADPSRIQQVVLNLLNNAVKFTSEGGRITVRLAPIDDNLQIQVTDTGQGIDAAFLPHLFERFRQADGSTSRRHGGLGLGLAIARQLVELHGGTIRADSAGRGHGATFTVELPALAPRHKSPPSDLTYRADDAPAAPFVASSLLRGVRVLVVEDDATTREIVEHLLEHSEAEVTAVESAVEALRAFKAALHQRRFDVLLSDVGLPEMNGHDLLRRIRDVERHAGNIPPTPAVALTAYATDKDRAQALAAGFNAHLTKPIVAASLVKTVADFVR